MADFKGLPKALQAKLKQGGAPRPPLPPPSGFGRYRLLEEIGKGGHGAVFRAVDSESKLIVAIKVLHKEVVSEELKLRMKREAHAMRQLAGTSAAAVYECNETAAGQLYLVMEYLEGQDLLSLIDSHERSGALVPATLMLQILEPVVSTLAFAHAHGIVHRDLKPENIFVLNDGRTRLVDFGLVKDLNLANMTEAGTVAGSPSYIAPEAWAGLPGALDHRIDIYALGVIAFRILTGRKPFESTGNMLDHILAVTTAPRPSLRALRPDLHASADAWVARALAIKPDERYQTVVELWDGLRAVIAQSGRSGSLPPPR